jgi:hypothetical protein
MISEGLIQEIGANIYRPNPIEGATKTTMTTTVTERSE